MLPDRLTPSAGAAARPMPRLGEILVQCGDCTQEIVDEALDAQLVYDGRLGTNLLELGVATEGQLARALSIQHGLPAVWGELEIQRSALDVLGAGQARRWEVVPFRLDRRCLDVLVSDARDPTRLDELAFAIGKEVRPVLVAEARLWELLSRCYGVPSRRRGATAVRPRGAGRSPGAPRAAAALRPAAAAPDGFGGALASAQEILADLQHEEALRTPAPIALGLAAAGSAPAAQAPAPAPDGFGGALVSNAQVLAEMQLEANRRYRPLASPPAALRAAPAVARAGPPVLARAAGKHGAT